eukprot:300891-Chlamydomonas_euryale.AAC.11
MGADAVPSPAGRRFRWDCGSGRPSSGAIHRQPSPGVELWIAVGHSTKLLNGALCMCTDAPACGAQVKKCADAGADIVRITVQGKREAEACKKIRQRLFEDG